MIANNSNKIINDLFSSLLAKYWIGLETSMKSSDFGFESIDGNGMHYISNKRFIRCSGSYTSPPDSIKKINVLNM